MFNEKVSESLCKIVREYGTNVCKEPSRLEGLLKDYCGEYKKEIFIIVATAKEGVPKDICDTNIPMEILKPRLVLKIEDNLWVTNEISESLVDLWLLALGKLVDKKLVDEKYVKAINKNMNTKKIYRITNSNNSSKSNMVNNVKQNGYIVKIGEYVQFGKYYNQPILWRVINIDSDGSPMIYSARILRQKPFYAAESGKDGQTDKDRQKYGSNKWENSKLREWLNSSDKVVQYTIQPPTNETVWYGDNDYTNEAGFLSNFSELERDEIRAVTRKSILVEIGKGERDGGGKEVHERETGIKNIVQDNDNACYENITDKVYLLDVKELHDYVFSNSKIGNYIKMPTKEAVANGEYKDIYINDKNIWWYWFKTPEASSVVAYSNVMNGVCHDGIIRNNDVRSHYACYGGGGVVPALNLKSGIFKSGKGTIAEPYVK